MSRIQTLHAWYCDAMGETLRLTMASERYWFEWIKADFNGEQLRTVILYLRKEIRLQRRNPGCLKLSNLLDVERFGDDLLLARHDLNKKLPPVVGTKTEGGGQRTEDGKVANDFNSPGALAAMEGLRRLKAELGGSRGDAETRRTETEL